MKAFVESHFGYCPLVWMLHSRTLNARINRIHERALRIVYGDDTSLFEHLLRKDNSFTIHERNVQTLAIELFKIVQGTSPEIMKSVFPLKVENRYNSNQVFETYNVRTVHNGINTISFLGPKIWSILPNDIKMITSLIDFKKKIRTWKLEKCPCHLCKTQLRWGTGWIISVCYLFSEINSPMFSFYFICEFRWILLFIYFIRYIYIYIVCLW